MSNQLPNLPPRRTVAQVNIVGTTQLHPRNPYVVAFWSAMFPGFGHLLLSRYIHAVILCIWDIFINLQAHVNIAFLLTLLGRFEETKAAIDLRWSLLYLPTYIFAVWDSYRATVELNKQYILASREAAPVRPFVINPFEVSFLGKSSPLVTATWCAMTPGLGHLMIHRLMHGIFVLVLWFVVVYQSNVLVAIHMTCFGQFSAVRSIVNPQWFLNIPSVLFFCVYAAYANTVQNNDLFEREQIAYIKDQFQSLNFPLVSHINQTAGDDMYIAAAFSLSNEVELTLTALEEMGIQKNNILAVCLRRESEKGRVFDTVKRSTGDSAFDLAMMLAALASLIGGIYGFVLYWGPVIWGVIGAFGGFILGFVIKMLIRRHKKIKGVENEVLVLVSCEKKLVEMVKAIFVENGALGVSPV